MSAIIEKLQELGREMWSDQSLSGILVLAFVALSLVFTMLAKSEQLRKQRRAISEMERQTDLAADRAFTKKLHGLTIRQWEAMNDAQKMFCCQMWAAMIHSESPADFKFGMGTHIFEVLIKTGHKWPDDAVVYEWLEAFEQERSGDIGREAMGSGSSKGL